MVIDNPFILLIEETNNLRLMIGMRWGDTVTNFIPLENTAFVIHPKRPHYETYGFEDYEMANWVKSQWENFFNKTYLRDNA